MSSSVPRFLMRHHTTIAKASLLAGFGYGFAFTLQKGQSPYDAAQGTHTSPSSFPFVHRQAPRSNVGIPTRQGGNLAFPSSHECDTGLWIGRE